MEDYIWRDRKMTPGLLGSSPVPTTRLGSSSIHPSLTHLSMSPFHHQTSGMTSSLIRPLNPSSVSSSTAFASSHPASFSHDHHLQRLRYQRERFHNIHQHYSLSSEEDFNRQNVSLHPRKSSTTPEPFSSLSQGDDDYSYGLYQTHPQTHPQSVHLASHVDAAASSPIHSPHSRLRYRRERFHQQHFSLSSSEDDSFNQLRRHPRYRNFHSAPEYHAGYRSFSMGSAGVEEDYSSYSSPHQFSSRGREEEILDAKIKRFLAHPITWTPSTDGTKLIGHMILKKCPGIDDPASPSLHSSSGSSAAQLGLKVVGGRITLGGTVGAVIEKVKRGSIADTIGRLRPGDEVLEWNGRSLQGSTFEETYDIMSESRHEPQVELIVCRHLRRIPMPSPVPPSPVPVVEEMPPRGSPLHHLRLHPEEEIISSGMTASSHSLSRLRHQHRHPLYEAYSEPFYSRSLDADDDGRPSFRKAASQPTHQFSHRSMSPSMSLRSPSADVAMPGGRISPPFYHRHHHQMLPQTSLPPRLPSSSSPASMWAAQHPSILPASSGPVTVMAPHSLSMSPSSKKRQLPQVPAVVTHHQQQQRRMTAAGIMTSNFPSPRRLSHGTQFVQHPHRPSSAAEAMTPMGMYSDSEVTTSRPSFASERIFYAHPTRPTSSAGNNGNGRHHHHHRHHRASRAETTSRRASSLARSMFSPTEAEATMIQTSIPQTHIDPRFESEQDPGLDSLRFESQHEKTRRESLEFIPRRSRRQQLLETRRYESEGGVGSRDRHMAEQWDDDRPHASFAERQRDRLRRYESEMMMHQERRESEEQRRHHEGDSETSSKTEGREGLATSSSKSQALGSKVPAPVQRRGAIAAGMKVQRSLDESGRSVGAKGSGTALHHSHGHLPSGSTQDVSLSDTALGPKSIGGSEEQLDQGSSEAIGATGGEDIGSDSGSKGGGVKPKGPSSSKISQLTGSKEGLGDLNKTKSSSTSQLSSAGTKKRLGFRKKTATSFSVHRSEEVAPEEVRHLVKQVSSASSDGEGSITGDSWVPAMRLQAEGDVSVFVEGLGPGQLVGRQALASVNYGDIQLSICERKGNIEVEVVRARNLMVKAGTRILPATYVKVHMWKHRKCVAKARTALARRTLDPLYQQQLIFHEDFREAVLQITVWGDYGKLDRKYFMGMAQVCLDDLDLSNIVIGWYKLFPQTTATLTNLAPSTALQEAREAKMAQMAANMNFFGE